MTKRFKLLTPIVGGLACNARCPFCVAGMTPENGVTAKAQAPDLNAFAKVCAFAKAHQCDSLLLTSKGEPTLWPEQVLQYLKIQRTFDFKSVELQTNGIPIADRKIVTSQHLRQWREYGLKLIAISVVHYDAECNRQTYLPHRQAYIDLPGLIAHLHSFGYAVRLAVVMLRGQIDSSAELQKMMDFARRNRVEQLTIRPVNKPDSSRDDEITSFVAANYLPDSAKAEIQAYLETAGTLVERLPWGGSVYDVGGQNVCLTNSLTKADENEDVGRQLIFLPDGRVSDDWQKEGVTLDAFVRAQQHQLNQ